MNPKDEPSHAGAASSGAPSGGQSPADEPVGGRLSHELLQGLRARAGAPAAGERLLGLGLDIVAIEEVARSLQAVGARFEARMYTAAERAYAASVASQRHARLAARFAAKEAAIKALSLSDAGIDWREIEVAHEGDGAPVLRLHGKVQALAARAGVTRVVISLSHDGPCAAAIVAALSDTAP